MGSGVWGLESGRKEAKGPGCAEPACGASFTVCLSDLWGDINLDGGGKSSAQKGQLDFCLQVKQVAEGEQKPLWKMAGLRRTLHRSILGERSRSR